MEIKDLEKLLKDALESPDNIQHYDAGKFIMSVNQVIEQLSITSYRYGIDISGCPKLTMDDFWEP